MPVVFRDRDFRFHFYSDEGDPRELLHVHVYKDGIDARLWLRPDVVYADNHGFDARTQRSIVTVVKDR
jgi:hypothetical protein